MANAYNFYPKDESKEVITVSASTVLALGIEPDQWGIYNTEEGCYIATLTDEEMAEKTRNL